MDLWLMAFQSAAACTWSLLKRKPACETAHQAHQCKLVRCVEVRGSEESNHRGSQLSHDTSLE